VVAVMAAPLLMVLADYRIGVVALTIVLPWANSPLLPRAQGLNVVTYLVLLSLVSLVVPKLFKRQSIVGLPRPVLWLYLLPVCIGMVVAWPHIPEGAFNLAGSEIAASYTQTEFLKIRFLKPMGWVIYALLLANAVRDSQRPERWLAAFAASSLLPVAVVFTGVAMFGGDLSALQARRGFLSSFGMHANDFGFLLMTECVPLLFVMAAAKGVARAAWAAVLALTVTALVLTFSRGAWLGFFVALMVFVVHRRQVRAALILVPLIAIAAAFAPQAVTDRLMTGFGEGRDSLLHSQRDELSAGRVASWNLLAPEVLRSPIVGRGIGSTAWSTAVRDRLYQAAHPHNLFLAIVMDLGLVGLLALGVLYLTYLRAFRRLAADEALTPPVRAFFAGAGATVVGILAMGMTNGDFMPSGQQTFYWFSLGMLFAYWRRAQQPRPATAAAQPVAQPGRNARARIAANVDRW
ncbi:MAG TPA: O-antigen ligase family protein, partial [Lysobacter sp.]|nr:O-antigen ligase family protein [Lysobacter sp.]